MENMSGWGMGKVMSSYPEMAISFHVHITIAKQSEKCS